MIQLCACQRVQRVIQPYACDLAGCHFHPTVRLHLVRRMRQSTMHLNLFKRMCLSTVRLHRAHVSFKVSFRLCGSVIQPCTCHVTEGTFCHSNARVSCQESMATTFVTGNTFTNK